MKYPILITTAVVIAVSSCKTPYKATDQPGAVADSKSSSTSAMDTSSTRSQSVSIDTTTVSMSADTAAAASQKTGVDSVRTSTVDSAMINQTKDSAINNASVDSARTKTTVDTASAKPLVDTANKQSMDTTTKSNADMTEKKASTSAVSAEAPAAVAPAFTKQYPGATNVEWTSYDSLAAVPIDMRLTGWKKMDAEDHMVKFDFKDETHYAWYDDKGKWIGTATPMEDVAKLPAPVKTAINNAIKTRYNGYAVSKMSKESQTGKKAYEIELAKDDSKVRMLVTSAGKVTQIFKYAAEKKE